MDARGATAGRRWPQVAALTVIGVMLAAVAGFLVWALTPLGPGPDALAALQSGDGVRVTETAYGWLFVAEDATAPVTGLVFYPG